MLIRLARLLRVAGADLAMLYYACRNPATPKLIKLLAAMLVLYVLVPIDLVPEFIPGLGLLDDVMLATLVIPALLKHLPDTTRTDAALQSANLMRRLAFWR